ncbi:oxidoreductase FAD/NAD(P)-binding domain protein [Fibrisoma limi BUZ 3]|uniref:Oxidoreductase FAD/NAD(P)-binding domain protein n=1 Tax=Fibrisoma limi BUZ 3 TaxID=1185876 RepID=I2GR97_9BACT|nr:2Fe-2S iron-sulfur cluster-binding protein [Fibrisoma limi]CCH56425.1 oxidoreductase FAD/NAD(P)-binding domain protein [Fibrisoma limi BUZ 3]
MNDEFLYLRITEIRAETPDAKSYWLEPVDGRRVPYRAGQFLTLIIEHGGHEVRRSYSLSSAPDVDQQLRLTIKRITNGEISRHLLDTLQVGDVLTSLPPAGRFTIDSNQPGDLLLLGAGSGITPLFSILKHSLHVEPGRRITLLYSSSNERNVIFRDELDDLQRQFPGRFRLLYLLSNPADDWHRLRGSVQPGRLNNMMLERLLPTLAGPDLNTVRCYVCGPADYMRMVQFTLVFSGLSPEQIRRENFVIDQVVQTPPPALAVDRTVLLRFRGREIDIQVPAYKSILQAALDEGVSLPYSCKGGRCSTCAARCLSGSVHMTINDVLTDKDLRDGWILTCTGYPESDGVIVEI